MLSFFYVEAFEKLDKNGCSLMLSLPTETTIEATNTSTDWRHPFHTYDDLFRQSGFTQDIVVNTDDVERNMEISNWKWSLRNWHHCDNQCFDLIHTSIYSNGRLPSPPLPAPSLVWEAVQKYVNRSTRFMKSLSLHLHLQRRFSIAVEWATKCPSF